MPRAEMQLPEKGLSPGDSIVAAQGGAMPASTRPQDRWPAEPSDPDTKPAGHLLTEPWAMSHLRVAGHLQAPRRMCPHMVTLFLWQGLKCVAGHFLAFWDNVRQDSSHSQPRYTAGGSDIEQTV